MGRGPQLQPPHARAHPILHFLYAKMREADISRERIAKKLLIDRAQLARIWRGEAHIRVRDLEKMLKHFGWEITIQRIKEE
mgnify:CR=1 FL=1